VDLQWIAPAECPREEAVRDKMRALAGLSLEELERLSAEGEITRVDDRYRLRLRVRLGNELRERVIESETCADLAGAAAVTLGLLLRSAGSTPEATGSGGASSGGAGAAGGSGPSSPSGSGGTGGASGSAGTPPAPPVPPTVPPADDRTRAPRGRNGGDDADDGLAFLLRAPVAAVAIGPLPHPGFDLGGGAGLGYAAWQFVLSGRVGSRQSIARTSLGGAGASVRRLAAELSVCRGFDTGPLELAPCLVAAVEHVTASGFGKWVAPRSRSAAWAAPGAGLLARLHLHDSLALVAGTTGYVEVARPHLVIDNVGEVDQLGPVALRAFIGTDWTF
jgi:hypothetical protein